MQNSLAKFAIIRSQRELVAKLALMTIVVTLLTDAVDVAINLFTQPDRVWPSLVQTTLIAAIMSLVFLGALGKANLRLYRMKEDYQALAFSDIQTNLLNRRGFFATLEQTTTSKVSIVLVILDVDHFKRINDGHGHLVGDHVIAAVGRMLDDLLPAPHFAGRIGGEEFAVALFGLSDAEAFKKAEELRWNISKLQDKGWPVGLTVTVSVGMAAMGERTVMETLARADKALYDAKHRGRNMSVSAEGLPGSNIVPLPIISAAKRT